MRQLAVHKLRPPAQLKVLQFHPKGRLSYEVRMMRPDSVLIAVEYASTLARCSVWTSSQRQCFIAVIPELDTDERLEEGGLAGISFKQQTAAAEDLESQIF
jgi:hypothetical protein